MSAAATRALAPNAASDGIEIAGDASPWTGGATDGLQTLRGKELDSNFPYAGAKNLVFAPFGAVLFPLDAHVSRPFGLVSLSLSRCPKIRSRRKKSIGRRPISR
jgi:hypothetical protein